jgi:tetratricopeptide (TPR) repeat protein
MKKIVLVMMMVAVAASSFAQNAKVQSASNYLRSSDLKKAKIAIDQASTHAKTGSQAKTYVVMGKIYYALSVDTTPKFDDIRKDAILKSAEAFEKAKGFADSRTDKNELYTYLYGHTYNKIYDEGVKFYNAKDFANAAIYFAKCGDIKATNEELDTIAYYYAANMSAANDDHEGAIKYFNKIKGSGYEDGVVYTKIANQYKAIGDTAKAVEVITEGRETFPGNQGLLIAEFNIYVDMGETEKAISNIDKAIEANPEKAAYYYVRGKLKETMATPDLAGAQADYEKTIELEPNHLDANHDLGALYVNKSVVVVEEMNALPYSDTKGYDAKKKELDDIFGKALPYLEKAYELDPKDTEVQGILKKLYLRTKDMDSYNKIQEEIKAAGGATE